MSVLGTIYMQHAAQRVSEVKDCSYSSIYGGLCHSFPIMVRQCGLSQAIAFSYSKASGDSGSDRAKAHKRILEDFKHLTGHDASDVANLEVIQYVIVTRRVLAAWIFYKRFAESILNVDVAQDGEDR